MGNPGGDDGRAWAALRVLLVAAGVVIGCLLLWKLSTILLLGFAAMLVALLLRASAEFIARHTPISEQWAVGLACLLIGAVLGGFVVLLGHQVRTQAADLVSSFPDIIGSVEDTLGVTDLGGWIEDRLRQFLSSSSLTGNVATYAAVLVGALANIAVVVAAGVYFALDPARYRQGALMLVPRERRKGAGETIDAAAGALKLWMLGQLAAMVMVGTLSAIGLWLIGVPSALALGLLAGLLEFVPLVGPVIAALPALALGLADGPTTALWVLGLYVLIQQIEGNLILPLVQQRAVDLPPPVTIFAILAFGILFGPLGLLLAAPLAVLTFVAVKKLWVREVLDEPVDVPGED